MVVHNLLLMKSIFVFDFFIFLQVMWIDTSILEILICLYTIFFFLLLLMVQILNSNKEMAITVSIDIDTVILLFVFIYLILIEITNSIYGHCCVWLQRESSNEWRQYGYFICLYSCRVKTLLLDFLCYLIDFVLKIFHFLL